VATDILRFAILGLGAGAVYGITALGVVLVYRGSGVLNFAHGAIGMVGAFVFYDVRDGGSPTWVAWAAALGVGAAFGVAMHVVVMRPLRHAPPISRLIATLGVFTLLLTWGEVQYGELPRIVGQILPVDGVEVLPGISIGENRLILLAVGLTVTAVLAVAYRFTKFGLATTAVASSRRITAAQGISPDIVATANWMLGCMLAVVGAVLIVSIAGLTVTGLTLLIVPALAAALLGSFRSFTVTMAGGLLIGILQSEVAWLQTYLTQQQGHPIALQGWTESVPFLVIILVLVARGRALPLRSDAAERPPEVGSGHIRIPLAAVVVTGSVLLVTFALSTNLVDAVTTSAALAIVLLSAVVVTGYAGQLSLAQFALAGVGAWIGASLVANQGASFELAALCGVAGAIPIGIVVGLPSLRTRGVNLAVATLGLALVIQSLILGNGDRTGGLTGLATGPPRFFGIDFDPVKYPERYALLSFACFALLAVAVANLRRGRAGRRLIAVRSNERAAASLGISVFGAKLYAFGLSAGIAAVGGLLIVFRRPIAVFLPAFSVFQSIIAVVYVVVGGVGFVLGPLITATTAPGGFFTVLLQPVIDFLNDDSTVQLIIAASLLVVLWLNPNGVAPFYVRLYHFFARRIRRIVERVVPAVPARGARWGARWSAGSAARREWVAGDLADPPASDTAASETPTVAPATLELESLGVRYGGVVALDDVSLVVHPGEIVGLIGPNGAGKTTLIDAVTGFARATGWTRLNERSLSRQSARARTRAGLGRSFQSLELFETMTVRENLQTASDRRDRWSYFSDLVWPARPRLGPHARAAVREFGLEEDLDRRPDELPFGRRRLVAIARAVAAGPSVLLLDEPAAGLDDGETAELGRLVGRLAREWGMGVLVVEHDVGLVLGTCDRVCVLDSGHHLATGTPDEIRRDPAVVAAYLGEPVAAPGEAPVEPGMEPGAAPEPVPEPVPEPSPAETAPEPARVAVRSGNGASAPLLAARGLHAGYGDLAAVRDLDLSVAAGEVVALIGPNGAGKTTTLLTLAGELAPLRGEVQWAGRVVSARRAPLYRRAREGLAFVPEERAVIPVLSTGANLRLGRGSVEDAVAFFPELEPLLRRRAGLLSGGEQQMLSLARALASKPRVLLIDELSLGLAPMLVARLLAAVRAAADRDGVGVLLVEQHAVEALAHADRVVVLRRGQVEMAGSAADLLGRLSALESAYLTDVSTGDVTTGDVTVS
jgi:sulfate-transporting ATPase